jgi:hypothetical protein
VVAALAGQRLQRQRDLQRAGHEDLVDALAPKPAGCFLPMIWA